MLNIKQIQEIIPHRYPFLLIDKIDELNNSGEYNSESEQDSIKDYTEVSFDDL